MRTSISIAPLIGVLAVLFTFVAQDFKMVQIQVPRRLDGISCGPDPAPKVQVLLHADSSVDLSFDRDTRHVEAPDVLPKVLAIVSNDPSIDAVYVAPDSAVTWQQFVETCASLQHTTALPVALVEHAPAPEW